MTGALVSAYWCRGCEVAGRTEASPALCWCCGEPATVTARVSPLPLDAPLARCLGQL